MMYITFVKSTKTLIFCDFFEAIDHTVVICIARRLSLKSNFNNFERLHYNDLSPTRDESSNDVFESLLHGIFYLITIITIKTCNHCVN